MNIKEKLQRLKLQNSYKLRTPPALQQNFMRHCDWMQKGLDLTDYFNYGFNEATLTLYVQKLSRATEANLSKIQKEYALKTQNQTEPWPLLFSAALFKDNIPLDYAGFSLPMHDCLPPPLLIGFAEHLYEEQNATFQNEAFPTQLPVLYTSQYFASLHEHYFAHAQEHLLSLDCESVFAEIRRPPIELESLRALLKAEESSKRHRKERKSKKEKKAKKERKKKGKRTHSNTDDEQNKITLQDEIIKASEKQPVDNDSYSSSMMDVERGREGSLAEEQVQNERRGEKHASRKQEKYQKKHEKHSERYEKHGYDLPRHDKHKSRHDREKQVKPKDERPESSNASERISDNLSSERQQSYQDQSPKNLIPITIAETNPYQYQTPRPVVISTPCFQPQPEGEGQKQAYIQPDSQFKSKNNNWTKSYLHDFLKGSKTPYRRQ